MGTVALRQQVQACPGPICGVRPWGRCRHAGVPWLGRASYRGKVGLLCIRAQACRHHRDSSGRVRPKRRSRQPSHGDAPAWAPARRGAEL